MQVARESVDTGCLHLGWLRCQRASWDCLVVALWWVRTKIKTSSCWEGGGKTNGCRRANSTRLFFLMIDAVFCERCICLCGVVFGSTFLRVKFFCSIPSSRLRSRVNVALIDGFLKSICVLLYIKLQRVTSTLLLERSLAQFQPVMGALSAD